MDDLVTWLRAQLDEDELWALAASAPYHGNGPTVAGGVHWTWAVGDNWEPIEVDPTTTYVGEPDDTCPVTLITREVFPLDWDPRGLNGRVLTAEEMRTGDGGHIIRHDPARVLREVEAKRRILDEHQRHPWFTSESIVKYPERVDYASCARCYTFKDNAPVDDDEHLSVGWPCPTARLLALPYADRPGYRDEWRP